MKLYIHPVSMNSRPIRWFIAEHDIRVEEYKVDLLNKEQLGEAYTALNPNQLVPLLIDGDLRLTECSAILKYLADTVQSKAYPQELKARAKVNEIMDWFNTNFYRDYGYNMCYPQIFPQHRREDEAVQAATIAWGVQRSKRWLRILNDHWLGSEKNYLCGPDMTIADYQGSCLLTLGEILRVDFRPYANIERWLNVLKSRPMWEPVNKEFYAFVDGVKDRSFITEAS